jgi:plasmid stabilization system protein ParE
VEDLEAIRLFISRDSARLADRFIRWVTTSVEQLDRFPFSGAVVPELNREDIREMVRGNYRVIYRATEELVEIIRIYHGARLFNERELF